MLVDPDQAALTLISRWEMELEVKGTYNLLSVQQKALLQSVISAGLREILRSDSYRNAPTSITEAKALRQGDASAWTPRDALLHLLRAIDAGDRNPSELVVIHREAEGRLSTCHTVGDPYTHIAMLEYAKAHIINEED